MKRIIAGATGFIGQHLVKRWLAAGHEIIVIGRSREKINKLFGTTVKAVTWEELAANGQPIIAGAQAIINLAGENIGAKLWSEQRKQEILLSRTQATATLAELCASLGAQSPGLLNASAIGVYGLQPAIDKQLPPAYDESTTIDFTQTPDFLAQVGRAWELAALPAKTAGVRVIWMRFGVVLAKEGGVLPQLSLPTKLFVGGPIGSGLQAFSWITLNDLCAAIDFLLDNPHISGAINLVAPGCVTQKQLAKALGRIFYRPSFIKTPAFVFKFMFGQMAEELLLSGQNVYPKRLLELGFKFQSPDIESALKKIYR